MVAIATQSSIKVIGANGQISLGRKYAGQPVLVEEQASGVWLVRTVTVIPDNERWVHQPKASMDLQSALYWAQTNPPIDINIDNILEKLNGEG